MKLAEDERKMSRAGVAFFSGLLFFSGGNTSFYFSSVGPALCLPSSSGRGMVLQSFCSVDGRKFLLARSV
jgi:hypothetical protein